MNVLLIGVISVLVLVATGAFILRDRGHAPTTVDVSGREALPTRDARINALVRDYLAVAFGKQEGDDAGERAEVERMRQNANAVVEELRHVYAQVPSSAYGLRWAIVYGAMRLESPAALDFLQQVVETPIPREESNNVHLHSTVAEESTIRMRAVEGLRLLADAGSTAATAALFNAVRLPSLSLRIAASQALISLPNRDAHWATLRDALSESERSFLDLRPAQSTDFQVANAPLGRVAAPNRPVPRTPRPPLAQDRHADAKPSIERPPTPKGPPRVS